MQERVQGPEWAGAVAHPSPEQLHRADQTRPGQPQGEPTSPETQGREGEHYGIGNGTDEIICRGGNRDTGIKNSFMDMMGKER